MKGILLVNIGTPAKCEKSHIQQFIAEMLSDPLLMEQKEWMCKLLARNIIAPASASKSLKKYSLIWRKEPPEISPLLYHMQKLAKALETSKNIPVEIAMRYGEPDITKALKKLEKKSPLLHEVVVFPMFPQYAQSTTETVINHIGNIFYKRPHSFRLKFVKPYYDHPAYIQALTAHAKPFLTDFDKLVFTYHSVPVSQVEKGWKKGKEFDYLYQLKETNRLFCEKLEIDPRHTFLFYSSQRGKNWLKPFLSTDIADLPKLGWKKIAVIAPGFPADNLETLYDINIEARELFTQAGGEKFTFVPSLNDDEKWVEAIWKIVSGVM